MTLSAFDHSVRATGLGASEAWKIVLGEGAVEVWERLLEPEVAAKKDPVGIAAREGALLEPLVAELYGEKTGSLIRGPMPTRRHPRWPFLLATFDRVVVGQTWVDNGTHGISDLAETPLGLVECKRPKWPAREWGDPRSEDPSSAIPRRYLVQAVVQLAVGEVPWCDVAALPEGEDEVRIYRIERDLELEGMVIDTLVGWWKRHVEGREAPPPDGSEAATRYLQRRFPKSRPQLRDAADEDLALGIRLADLRAARKKIEQREEILVQQLKARCADAEGIAGVCTWKAPESGAVSWKSIAEELGASASLIAKHTAAEPTRRFLLSKKLEEA